MSATRDHSQPITFVFNSLHEVYKKGLKATQEADVDHPRFGAQAPEGLEKLYSLRSETYRVLKPRARPEVRKGALRSTQRVLKLGQAQPGQIHRHHPVTFLRKEPQSKVISNPGVRSTTDAQVALQRIQSASVGPDTSRRALNGIRDTLSRLDRLQSRLHFLLREIRDYSSDDIR